MKANEAIRKEFEKVWGDDTHMIDYCMKQVSSFATLADGKMIIFEKKDIRKNFCFGYSTCGQGPEWEQANRNEARFLANVEKRFISENLEEYDRIEELMNDERKKWYIARNYYKSEKLMSLFFLNLAQAEDRKRLLPDLEEVKDCDRQAIRNAEQEARKAFEKRLSTYWKRNGAKNIRTWTYWIDE